MTLYKKTRHKSQFTIWHNAMDIKVKSLFCFLLKLKVKFTNEDEVKSVPDNAVLSPALYSAVCIAYLSVLLKSYFLQSDQYTIYLVFSCTVTNIPPPTGKILMDHRSVMYKIWSGTVNSTFSHYFKFVDQLDWITQSVNDNSVYFEIWTNSYILNLKLN